MPIILPKEYGSTYNKRLVQFYVAIYHKRFGEFPKIQYSMPFYVQMKRAFEKYGEIKVAAAMLMHFEQNSERIIKEKFPIQWLWKNIPEYLQKLQDLYGVNVDNNDELYDAVKNRINYLAINFNL